MLSKRYEYTEVDRRTLQHVPKGELWSSTCSIDAHQVTKNKKNTSAKMDT